MKPKTCLINKYGWLNILVITVLSNFKHNSKLASKIRRLNAIHGLLSGFSMRLQLITDLHLKYSLKELAYTCYLFFIASVK